MDQCQLANAAEKIDGYYLPCASDVSNRQHKAFDRAQTECLGHMKAQLDAVKSLTFEQFMVATRRKKLLDAELGSASQGVAA